MIDTFNRALLFRRPWFEEMRERPDLVRHGLTVVLLVGLLVGGISAMAQFLAVLDPARAIAPVRIETERQFDEFTALNSNTPEQAAVFNDIIEITLVKFTIVERIATLPAVLPTPLGALLAGLGIIASMPLVYLGELMLAVVFTHLAARQLGGSGSIQQMLGLGAFSAAPHALDALLVVPGLGSALQIVATGWGFAILILATATAHRLDTGKALLAVVLYPLILGLVGLVVGCGLLVLLTFIGASAI